jgi:hypothetical protein
LDQVIQVGRGWLAGKRHFDKSLDSQKTWGLRIWGFRGRYLSLLPRSERDNWVARVTSRCQIRWGNLPQGKGGRNAAKSSVADCLEDVRT